MQDAIGGVLVAAQGLMWKEDWGRKGRRWQPNPTFKKVWHDNEAAAQEGEGRAACHAHEHEPPTPQPKADALGGAQPVQPMAPPKPTSDEVRSPPFCSRCRWDVDQDAMH